MEDDQHSFPHADSHDVHPADTSDADSIALSRPNRAISADHTQVDGGAHPSTFVSFLRHRKREPTKVVPSGSESSYSRLPSMLGSFSAQASMDELRRLLLSNEARVRKWKTWTSLFAALCLLLLGALAVMRVHERTATEVIQLMADRLALEHRRVADWLHDVAPVDWAAPPYHPGREARARGERPQYNVLLVPGFVTSGLELWEGPSCASNLFRSRVWGQMSMMRTVLANMSCFLEIMHLDVHTGLDPPGIRLRPMQSLSAIDYFLPTYTVWGGIITALSDLGYDPENDLAAAPFDWRLSLQHMEARDHWFTKVKAHIELQHKLNGRRTLILGHSWGANVVLNMLFSVEEQQPGWVDKHVATFVNIGGPLLGVPKTISALLSGEMRDTVEVGALVKYLTENFVGRKARSALFRTWGSVVQMLPVGGPAAWGNTSWAPDDPPAVGRMGSSVGALVTAYTVSDATADTKQHAHEEGHLLPAWLRASMGGNGGDLSSSIGGDAQDDTQIDTNEQQTHDAAYDHKSSKHNMPPPPPLCSSGQHGFVQEPMDVDAAVSAVIHDAGSTFASNALGWLDRAMQGSSVSKFMLEGGGGTRKHTGKHAPGVEVAEHAKHMHVELHNPLTTKLPHAPALRMYCLYGVGKPADRAFHYLVTSDVDAARQAGVDPNGQDHEMENGVVSVDGDGTVPLLSLGVMCRQPWAHGSPLNPGNVTVVTKEYRHEEAATSLSSAFQLQGGPASAAHVDILANHELLADIVALAAGKHVDQRVLTNIDSIAGAVWSRANTLD